MSDVLKRCTCANPNKCKHKWQMATFWRDNVPYRTCVTDWALAVLGKRITTRTEADACIPALRASIEAGTYVNARAARTAAATATAGVSGDPTAMTLDALVVPFKKWLTSTTRAAGERGRRDGKRSAATTAACLYHVQQLVDFEGNGAKPVAAIDAAALVRLKASLGDQSASTWAKFRGTYMRLFTRAQRLGVITRSPLDLVESDDEYALLKRQQQFARTRRLMPGEFERLHAAALDGPRAFEAQRLADMVETARECGGREGELGALQVRDVVDVNAPYVGGYYTLDKVVRIVAVEDGAAKTGEPREVPQSTRLRALLTRRMRNTVTGQPLQLDDYLLGNKLGERIRFNRRSWENCVIGSTGQTPERIKSGKGKQQLTPASHAVYTAVGLHFHDIRREFASRMWYSGKVLITDLRDWLGHSTVEQTEDYLGIPHGSSTRGVETMAAVEAELSRREAVAVAVGGATDHDPITNGGDGAPGPRGPRLVKGRKAGAGR